MTREEIEAACEIVRKYKTMRAKYPLPETLPRFVDHARAVLADAYLAEHSRDTEPPTREMFERLNISDYRGTLEWDRDYRFPRFYADGWFVEIPTIAKLRAACLLLGISTEGIL